MYVLLADLVLGCMSLCVSCPPRHTCLVDLHT